MVELSSDVVEAAADVELLMFVSTARGNVDATVEVGTIDEGRVVDVEVLRVEELDVLLDVDEVEDVLVDE